MVSNEAADLAKKQKGIAAQIGVRKAQGEDVADLIRQHAAVAALLKGAREETAADAIVPEPCPRSADTDALQVEWLTNPEALVSLKDEWDRLLAATRSQNVFMTWEFIGTWYEMFGLNGQMRCATVRNGSGELVAVAPFVEGCTNGGPFASKAISFAATDSDRPRCSYPSILTRPGCAVPAYHALLSSLNEPTKRSVSFIRLRHMAVAPEELSGLLKTSLSHGYRCTVSSGLHAVRGYAGNTYEEFVSRIPSASRRKFLVRTEEDIKQQHGAARLVASETAEEVARYVDMLVALSIKRHRAHGTKSRFEVDNYRSFLHKLSERLWRRGGLRLAELRLEGQPVAAQFGYLEGEWFYLMHTGMAPGFEKANPGHAIMAFSLKCAMAEGATHIDMGPGEHAYKRDYLPTAEQLVTVTLFRNWRGRMNAALGTVLRPGR